MLLRKYGQEVIRHTAGKRVHGTGSVPGGVNKNLSLAERDELLKDIYQMIGWAVTRCIWRAACSSRTWPNTTPSAASTPTR